MAHSYTSIPVTRSKLVAQCLELTIYVNVLCNCPFSYLLITSLLRKLSRLDSCIAWVVALGTSPVINCILVAILRTPLQAVLFGFDEYNIIGDCRNRLKPIRSASFGGSVAHSIQFFMHLSSSGNAILGRWHTRSR